MHRDHIFDVNVIFPMDINIEAWLLRYCRNVHPTWVRFGSKDTKESGWVTRF